MASSGEGGRAGRMEVVRGPRFGVELRISPGAVPPIEGPIGATDGLLLIGHGSRCAASAAEMRTLAAQVSTQLPTVAVDVGFLEMTDPAAPLVLDDLVSRGCRRIVVLPLVLLGAGHAKSDVPAVVVDGRDRHPGVELRFGRPLGVTRELVATLGDAVVKAGGGGLALVVVGRGTSDPDANSDAFKAARLLAEWTSAPFVTAGFTGVTEPSAADALDVVARLGFGRIAVAWWFLCHGKLIERSRDQLRRVVASTGADVLDVGHIGADPRVVSLICERWREALSGPVVVNCDTCAYRAPWPGLEGRVGQAVGIGHSHLAREHRHGAHTHVPG
jgi:sirohydrochlorin ferrochelatase